MEILSEDTKFKIIDQSAAFQELSLDEKKFMAFIAKVVKFSENTTIYREKSQLDHFYLIVSGTVDITSSSASPFVITTLAPYEIVGEISFTFQTETAANAKSVSDTTLLAFSTQDTLSYFRLKKLIKRFKKHTGINIDATNLKSHLIKGFNNVIDHRLTKENKFLIVKSNLAHQKKMIESSRGLVLLILLMCIYIYFLKLFQHIFSKVMISTISSIGLLLVFSALALCYLKLSDKKISEFGLTWKGGVQATKESLLFTIPILLLLICLKYTLIRTVPSLASEPLFNIHESIKPNLWPYSTHIWFAVILFSYAVIAIMQEFLVRGIFQSMLNDLFIGKHRLLRSIVISNLIFSIAHIHISEFFVFIIFFLGLFWGWLYNRHKTLIGVSLSHILIGLFGAFMLNFDFIIFYPWQT